MFMDDAHRPFQFAFTAGIDEEIGRSSYSPGGMIGHGFIDTNILHSCFDQFFSDDRFHRRSPFTFPLRDPSNRARFTIFYARHRFL